jgi:hypothetical protein
MSYQQINYETDYRDYYVLDCNAVYEYSGRYLYDIRLSQRWL